MASRFDVSGNKPRNPEKPHGLRGDCSESLLHRTRDPRTQNSQIVPQPDGIYSRLHKASGRATTNLAMGFLQPGALFSHQMFRPNRDQVELSSWSNRELVRVKPWAPARSLRGLNPGFTFRIALFSWLPNLSLCQQEGDQVPELRNSECFSKIRWHRRCR